MSLLGLPVRDPPGSSSETASDASGVTNGTRLGGTVMRTGWLGAISPSDRGDEARLTALLAKRRKQRRALWRSHGSEIGERGEAGGRDRGRADPDDSPQEQALPQAAERCGRRDRCFDA